MKAYTLCFIQRGKQILLLNRQFAPNLGLWNGVGGKIEPGETVLKSALREIKEETGMLLLEEQLKNKGEVSWLVEGEDVGGLHIFHAVIPMDVVYPTPLLTDEGILDWKDLDWIMDEENLGIAEIVPKMLENMIVSQERYEYIAHYKNDKLINCEQRKIGQK